MCIRDSLIITGQNFTDLKKDVVENMIVDLSIIIIDVDETPNMIKNILVWNTVEIPEITHAMSVTTDKITDIVDEILNMIQKIPGLNTAEIQEMTDVKNAMTDRNTVTVLIVV